ncbi:sialic acid-binding Ig-like lectin 10 [Rhinoraja longicauda]
MTTVNLVAIVILSRGNCGLSKCISRYLLSMAVTDLLVIITAVMLNRIPAIYFPGSFLAITPICSFSIALIMQRETVRTSNRRLSDVASSRPTSDSVQLALLVQNRSIRLISTLQNQHRFGGEISPPRGSRGRFSRCFICNIQIPITVNGRHIQENTMIRQCCFLLLFLQAVQSGEWTMRALSRSAISGSCVVIPCTFDFPSHRYTAIHGAWFKYWYKWKYTVTYSRDPNYGMTGFKKRAKIVGNLGEKDCSLRIDHLRPEDSDVYYFYVELDGFETYTYTHPVQLNVLDVPDKPEILIPETLTEGTPVNILCKVLYPCPEDRPSLTWSELPDSTINELGEKTSGEYSTVLTFTPSVAHHGQTVRCTVDYFGTSHRLQNSVTLNVIYSPQNTVVELTFKEANTISLRCSSDANPNAISFSWFKITGGVETDLSMESQNITVHLESEKAATSYSCTVTNALGSSRSAPVRIPSRHLTDEAAVLSWAQCTRYPSNVTCRCIVQSNFPVNVTWGFLDRTIVLTDTAGDVRADCVRAGSLVTITLIVRGVNLTVETVNFSVSNPRWLEPLRAELEVRTYDGTGDAPATEQGTPRGISGTPLAFIYVMVVFLLICFVVAGLMKKWRRQKRYGNAQIPATKEHPEQKSNVTENLNQLILD